MPAQGVVSEFKNVSPCNFISPLTNQELYAAAVPKTTHFTFYNKLPGQLVLAAALLTYLLYKQEFSHPVTLSSQNPLQGLVPLPKSPVAGKQDKERCPI